MNRTCPKCEELNPANADFCKGCGYRIVVEASLTKLHGRERRQYVYDPRMQRA